MPTDGRDRILVVEDETFIRARMTGALKDAGFQIDEAEAPEEAFRLLDADRYRPIVTDIHVPGGLSRIDLAERVKGHMPRLPVLIVTGRPRARVPLETAQYLFSAVVPIASTPA